MSEKPLSDRVATEPSGSIFSDPVFRRYVILFVIMEAAVSVAGVLFFGIEELRDIPEARVSRMGAALAWLLAGLVTGAAILFLDAFLNRGEPDPASSDKNTAARTRRRPARRQLEEDEKYENKYAISTKVGL